MLYILQIVFCISYSALSLLTNYALRQLHRRGDKQHPDQCFQAVSGSYEVCNLKLWSEFSSRAPETLINTMSRVKARRYACGMLLH